MPEDNDSEKTKYIDNADTEKKLKSELKAARKDFDIANNNLITAYKMGVTGEKLDILFNNFVNANLRLYDAKMKYNEFTRNSNIK